MKRDVGIPRTYYEVLFVLGASPTDRMRMTAVAQGTRSAPSRVTHAIGKLEKLGLLTRHSNPKDKREFLVELTGKGASVLQAAAKCHAASVRAYLLDALSERQQDELRRISARVIQQIETQAVEDSHFADLGEE
ncbi:MarR family transcriptional regulator [Mesorhizobium sp. M1E.F.Ca.ET.063.01.1.1]|uniref:MarR family winged helix-turn-helix transcriptional regulator n=1 Tax=Mesorhizobium sp. M1E.F.Ca.ET.063.01.1.1 TaxID=2496750 RepID=UPI00167385BD|nr:MarR family transcriptional regulator [Mesorhizobium sp. M1E.F.Ca.ET.063.01.1.1]